MKYGGKIRELRCRVEEEKAVINELAAVLEDSAAQMRRHDQAAVVGNLRDRVMSEVGSIRRTEAAAPLVGMPGRQSLWVSEH